VSGRVAMAATSFVLDLSFQYQAPPGQTSASTQAIEFGMTKWQGSANWDWGVAWGAFAGDDATWRFFNGTDWQDTGVAARLEAGRGHSRRGRSCRRKPLRGVSRAAPPAISSA